MVRQQLNEELDLDGIRANLLKIFSFFFFFSKKRRR